MIRKGKEFYYQQYEKAMQLHSYGKSAKEISLELNVSYSSVYTWIKGKRIEKGSINELVEFLEKNGPSPVIFVKEMFPSHDDLYHTARERGIRIRRYCTKSKMFGNASNWYYLNEQEDELKKRILDMVKKYKELKEKFVNQKA